MVEQYSKRGFYEWVGQRVTAVIILVYFVVLLSFIFSSMPEMTYGTWLTFYSQTYIRILTVLATFAILWHAWIGIWTVFTDYIKLNCLRLFLQILVLIYLSIIGIWVLIAMSG